MRALQCSVLPLVLLFSASLMPHQTLVSFGLPPSPDGIMDACWHPGQGFDGFAQSTIYGCPTNKDENSYLVGGSVVKDGKPSTDYSTSSLSHSFVWKGFSLPVAVDGQGSCSTTPDGNLYISSTANRIAQQQNYFYVLPPNSPVWVAKESSLVARYRASIQAIPEGIFIFGGKSTIDHTPVHAVEFFDTSSTSPSWNFQYASIKDLDEKQLGGRGLCDCASRSFRAAGIFLACATCNNTKYEDINILVIHFDPLTRNFSWKSTLVVPKSEYLSFEAANVAQFMVFTVALKNETQGAGPRVYFYDVVMEKAQRFAASNMQQNRYAGSMLPVEEFLSYTSGLDFYTNGSISNSASQLIDYIQIYPSIRGHANNPNLTYIYNKNSNNNEPIIVEVTDVCRSPFKFRLALNRDCSYPVPGTVDQVCGTEVRNSVVFRPSDTFSAAYMCATLGTCKFTNASALKKCTNYNSSWTFTDCHLSGCCYREGMPEGFPKCYQYVEGESDKTEFYYNIIRTPFRLELPVDTQTKKTPFLKTTVGIAAICGGCGVVLILLATAVYICKRKPDYEEHPLEANSKYKLITKLGQGGFGTVFLVEKKVNASNEQFAMKYIACQSEEDRGYAMKEIELVRSCQGHPNMIRLVDMFLSWGSASNESSDKKNDSTLNSSADDSSTLAAEKTNLLSMAPRYVCIVMEYFPEGDLSNYILDYHRRGAPEDFLLYVLCKQVCSCLHHIHGLRPPIVHRDLKPENLLLADNQRRIVVTDFGLAQTQEKSYMTTRAGSLHYVAPECWKRQYTCAVDMWGLGCIVYACATGRVSSDTARVMFSDARDKKFEQDIRYDLRKFSKKLQDIVMGLLQVDPKKRLKSGQVLEMLGDEVEDPNLDCYCN